MSSHASLIARITAYVLLNSIFLQIDTIYAFIVSSPIHEYIFEGVRYDVDMNGHGNVEQFTTKLEEMAKVDLEFDLAFAFDVHRRGMKLSTFNSMHHQRKHLTFALDRRKLR